MENVANGQHLTFTHTIRNLTFVLIGSIETPVKHLNEQLEPQRL